jgi:hypothetical protein
VKRSAFRQKGQERRPQATIEGYTPRSRAVAVAVAGPARACVPVPKMPPARDEAYRRRVAELPCAHCGKPGPSQCAHSDNGKGLAMKSSDYECYPLCADSPGRTGCHSMIGASAAFAREQRRHLEQKYAAATRRKLEIE